MDPVSSSPIDYVSRAVALAPAVREAASEAEQQRHVPKPVAEAMAAAGLYGVAAPASVGGGETHPHTQIRTIEAISEADGGIGWALMIGIETGGLLAGFLAPEVAREIYADPGLITSGAINPLGTAQRVGGGYRISGQWPFASGVHNAQYFWGQCMVVDDRGERVKGANAPFELCEALLPASELEILDTWKTSGLRGSGSHDVRVHDVVVPDARMTWVQKGPPRESGTLFRYPFFSRLAYNKVGVSTGIARAAIRHFIDLASQKTPRGSFKPLRERGAAQRAVADAERTLRSARAFVFEAVAELWDAVDAGGRGSDEQRAMVQLSCSNAAAACIDAVAPLLEAAGTSSNFDASPLGRCWRDVQVVRQHIMVSPQWIEAVGRTLLGSPSGSPFF